MSDAVNHVLTSLRKKGYKRTPQREMIVEILHASDAPLTAKEVHEQVKEAFPHVSLDTVYRNLQLLTEAGLASQINLQSPMSARFELHRGGDHHHHLVCLDCGVTVCLPECPLDDRTLASAKKQAFTLVGHAFELYGYCQACQA